jgi:excisionase family DNA binding protein
MPPAPDRVAYSITETAQRIGVSRSFLYLEIGRGHIASTKIGRRRVIRIGDAEAYMAAHSAVAGAANSG